ncbi:DUF4367 domain-containing protein [Pygmaiobacter massiliensis]|uniref:DUF4367 domain-containing protein n=1 Tax=Pygmaiobacter massiliensis TaxID=1917873 RepID=UPI000C7ADF82|nr:DUF4367 domain-containing protein [Pygmaiobacter massiliensis]
MNHDQLQLSVDALLALAVTEAEAREMAELPSLNEMNRAFEPSTAFQARIERVIRKNDKKERRRKTRFYIKRTSTVLAASVALFSCVMLPVRAVRQAVVETFIEWRDKFSSIVFSSKDNAVTELPGTIELEYVPEGYQLQETVSFDRSFFNLKYTNNTTNYFSVSITVIGDNYVENVDNEHSQYYSLEFDGNQALWVACQDGSNFLIWNKDNLAYNVSGSLDIAELVCIAQGINFS